MLFNAAMTKVYDCTQGPGDHRPQQGNPKGREKAREEIEDGFHYYV